MGETILELAGIVLGFLVGHILGLGGIALGLTVTLGALLPTLPAEIPSMIEDFRPIAHRLIDEHERKHEKR